jgi:hypothetical protein
LAIGTGQDPVDRKSRLCWGETIDLCCHDEVVPVEIADLVRPESHRHLTPFGENRGMVAFSLGERTNAIRKG